MAYKNIHFALTRVDFNRLLSEHFRSLESGNARRATQIEQTIWEFVEFASRTWELEHSRSDEIVRLSVESKAD